jgi:hypothetical protein
MDKKKKVVMTPEQRKKNRTTRFPTIHSKNKGFTPEQLRKIRAHEFNFWGEPRR